MLKNKLLTFFLFLSLNFLALYLGVVLMDNGPKSEWYLLLNKAPWTPPNWMFGSAWSLIMILFSFYMTILLFKYKEERKKIVFLYIFQWILNVSWNYIFFNKHLIIFGAGILVVLWGIIAYILFTYKNTLKLYSTLLLPYFVWMAIAVSLNIYIIFNKSYEMPKLTNITQEKIIELYAKDLLEGKETKIIYVFAKKHNFDEHDFYKFFSSFEELEKSAFEVLKANE